MIFFEVTIFCENKGQSREFIMVDLTEIGKLSDKLLAAQFNDDKEWYEIRFSFGNLEITNENLHYTVETITKFIDQFFGQDKHAILATGIYEVTYDITEHAKSIDDLKNLLLEFPLLFLRKDFQYNFGKVLYTSEDVYCVYQEQLRSIIKSKP